MIFSRINMMLATALVVSILFGLLIFYKARYERVQLQLEQTTIALDAERATRAREAALVASQATLLNEATLAAQETRDEIERLRESEREALRARPYEAGNDIRDRIRAGFLRWDATPAAEPDTD